MTRYALAGLVLLTTACAASHDPLASGRAPVPGVQVTSAGTDYELREEGPSATRRIDLSINDTWQALRGIYQTMEIPVTRIDQANGVLGNPSFTASRRLAGHPMTALFNCGNSMTGPNAATYRLTISMLTHATPVPTGGTNVRTLLTATGLGPGTSTAPVQCLSTGRLEQEIVRTLQQRAQVQERTGT